MKRITVLYAIALMLISNLALGQSLFEQCKSKDADIKAVDLQISQLEMKILDIDKSMKDLMRKKKDAQKEKNLLARKITREKMQHKRMCIGLRQCDAYDKNIERMKERIGPWAEKMKTLRDEMRRRQQDLGNHVLEVEKIEKTYQELDCDNLVPGQVAQSTIDRCNDLFSNWNKLETNRASLVSWLNTLRTRYQKIMKKMRSHSAEIAKLSKKMRESCSHSSLLADLENMDKNQKDYNSMKTDIDQMDSRVKKVRKFKIRRPRAMIRGAKKHGVHKADDKDKDKNKDKNKDRRRKKKRPLVRKAP